MPIPRPQNLKPARFRDNNWIATDDFHGHFYQGPLRLRTFLSTFFQNPKLETELEDQIPWDFLLRPPHIQRNAEGFGDHQWEPVRILGAGNFGRVGLWRKRENSKTVDEIAIKEANRPAPNTGYECDVDGVETGLAMEAAINADLNSQPASGHISFLRSFRLYLGPRNKGGGKYRFYFNFCPYDNLDTLARRYRMWDEWLPEAFIWHLLIQLSRGLQTLEQRHPDDTLMPKPKNAPSWIIHCDLKPANVLVDYASERDECKNVETDGVGPMDYPEIRISDFGLSMYTHEDEPGNPQFFTDGGTDGYKPPEQTQHKDDWGVDFRNPPSTKRDRFTKAHNTWCVGKIIHDVMTLESPGTLDRVRKATTEEEYRAMNEHFLSPTWGEKKYWEGKAAMEQHRLKAYKGFNLDPSRRTRTQTEGQTDSNTGDRRTAAPNTITAGPRNANQIAADKAKAYVEAEWRVREEAHQKKKKEENQKQQLKDIEKAGSRKNQYVAMSSHWYYSKPLRDLVWQMLEPNPNCRPPSSEILEKATENLEALIKISRSSEENLGQSKPTSKTAAAESSHNDLKLYYRATEINEMSRGKGNHEPSDAEYTYLLGKCDPDWVPLKPPREKWQEYEKTHGPRAPRVDVYERSRRIRDALVKLKDPDAESPRMSPRTTDAYGDMDYLDLAREVAKGAEADDVEDEALRLMKANSMDQLVKRLLRLRQKNVHQGQMKKVPEPSLPVATTGPAPKRSLEEPGENGTPKKKRDKKKGKAVDVEIELPEDSDMYRATSANGNNSTEVDEREASCNSIPDRRPKTGVQSRRGKQTTQPQQTSAPFVSGGRPERAAKEAANKKITAKPRKPPKRGVQSTHTQQPSQNKDEHHDDDEDDVAEEEDQHDQIKKRGSLQTTAKTANKAPAKKAPAKALAKKQARGGEKGDNTGKRKGRTTAASKGGAKGGGARGGVKQGGGGGGGKGKRKA